MEISISNTSSTKSGQERADQNVDHLVYFEVCIKLMPKAKAFFLGGNFSSGSGDGSE